MATPADWKVLPHRPIEKLAENLWRVEGDLEGMPLKRVMTVVKTARGELVVHNAMALDEASMAALDAWGPVTKVIVPNGYHRIDAPRFRARYPKAEFYCPRAVRGRVEAVVPVTGTYDDFPSDDTLHAVHLDGLGEREGAFTVRSNDGVTIVLNDAVFNMPHVSGSHGWVFRHITKSSGGPRVTRLAKLALVKDKKAFRAHLERLAEAKDLRRVIVSHHELIADAPSDALRLAASTV